MYRWLSLLFLLVLAPEAEAQITTSLRVSWRTEQNPLDPKRGEIDVPYLHVVYHNKSKTDYYFIRRDKSRWIFPHIDFVSLGLFQMPENVDYLHGTEVTAMEFKIYPDSVRAKKIHQVKLMYDRDPFWGVDQRLDSKGESYTTDPNEDWSSILDALQYILFYMLKLKKEQVPYEPWLGYKMEDELHVIAKDPLKTQGKLRLLEGLFAFLPAGSEREYVYSLLAFRLVRGRYHFVIPNWVAKETEVFNKAFERADDPNGGKKELILPRIYEGYHLYRGRVRGDSIWINM